MRFLRERQLDGRVAWDVEQLARWWTSTTQEARFQLLKTAVETGTPPLEKLRFAIILAEAWAGEVEEG